MYIKEIKCFGMRYFTSPQVNESMFCNQYPRVGVGEEVEHRLVVSKAMKVIEEGWKQWQKLSA